MAKTPDPSFKGPWSDLPPPEPPPSRPPRLGPSRLGPSRLRPARRTGAAREPFIRNWRGLLIVVFLLFVAPWLASFVAHLIMTRLQGGGAL